MTRRELDRRLRHVVDRVPPRDYPRILAALATVATRHAPATPHAIVLTARAYGYPAVTVEGRRLAAGEAAWAAAVSTANPRQLRALQRALEVEAE
jgi:hypothetical protein